MRDMLRRPRTFAVAYSIAAVAIVAVAGTAGWSAAVLALATGTVVVAVFVAASWVLRALAGLRTPTRNIDTHSRATRGDLVRLHDLVRTTRDEVAALGGAAAGRAAREAAALSGDILARLDAVLRAQEALASAATAQSIQTEAALVAARRALAERDVLAGLELRGDQ